MEMSPSPQPSPEKWEGHDGKTALNQGWVVWILGEKGLLKHKENTPTHPGLGGSQSCVPECSSSLGAPGDMGTATASLPGKAGPRGWGMGKRSCVEGLMAAVNRSEQRPHRSLLCGAVIRLSWGRGVLGCVSRKGN